MRLDKFLCDRNIGSRSEIKTHIKKGLVTVNGMIAKAPDQQVGETDTICFKGTPLNASLHTYLMLNKPKGVITAVTDKSQKTVMDLCREEGFATKKDLSPVGRLDKDTEGLLIITDDGDYLHLLTSPRHHVKKTYEVTVDKPFSQGHPELLKSGLSIGDGDVVEDCRYEITSENTCSLTIREGKFHQVKRMMHACGFEVTALKRRSMGALMLPEDLPAGSFREMTELDILKARELQPKITDYEAVIFDVDGSLVDSMGMWKEIDIEYLGKFGLELPTTLQSEIEGMSFIQTAEYIKARFPVITDPIEVIMDDWNNMAADHYRHKVPCKKGVMDFLKYCKDHKIKLGVATSNSRYLWSKLDEQHHFTNYLDTVVTGTEVTNGKPAPDIYLKAAENLGVSPAKCLVFEDILPGIYSAKAAGMQVCAVDDPYSKHQEIEKRKEARFYIRDYDEIWR